MAIIRSKAFLKRALRLGKTRDRELRLDLTISKHPLEYNWAAAISADEWAIYRSAMDAVRESGVPFMLGGGFALASYTGRWRDTKDIDFYINPGDREKVKTALRKAGFEDYFDQAPYDRRWIYRSVRKDVIVDIIWAMANQRTQVDQVWFDRAGSLSLRSQHLMVVPIEEFIWCKLYIVQRDHCDWTDIFNVLYTNGRSVDWKHLLWRLEDDTPLLRAMLTTYGWLCPAKIQELPSGLWKALGMEQPAKWTTWPRRDRIRLLDSRHWFVGHPENGEKLEV